MATVSPLNNMHESSGAQFLSYGPIAIDRIVSSAGASEQAEEGQNRDPINVVAAFADVEIEYATLRKAAGVIDLPHHGTVLVKGTDAMEFLNRMLTNDVQPIAQRQSVRAFWLNRKGRIQADVVITALENGDVVMDVNAFASSLVTTSLNTFLFSEDVTIVDVTQEWHRIRLCGPRCKEYVAAIVDDPVERSSITELELDHFCSVTFNESEVMIHLGKHGGELSVDVLCPCSTVGSFVGLLMGRNVADGLRPVGWAAFNIARIEAGEVAFLTDFGFDSLPHEAGEVLHQAVSFKKGCYLGQEIVARMESQGHAKQCLVGLRFDNSEEEVPSVEAPVYAVASDGQPGDCIGVITSAAPSPMLGSANIAFAMMKYDAASVGTAVVITTPTGRMEGAVHTLEFWSASTSEPSNRN